MYVTDYKYDADLIVYKCDYKYSRGNKGYGISQNKYDADKVIYFTDYKYDADIIYILKQI